MRGRDLQSSVPSLTHAGGVVTRLTAMRWWPDISSPRARTAGMKVPMRPYRAHYARDRVSPLGYVGNTARSRA